MKELLRCTMDVILRIQELGDYGGINLRLSLQRVIRLS
jgi:hypothetical protein